MADKKPDLWVRPMTYQPKKAEKEADMSINASPDQIAAAVMRPVNVKIIGKGEE